MVLFTVVDVALMMVLLFVTGAGMVSVVCAPVSAGVTTGAVAALLPGNTKYISRRTTTIMATIARTQPAALLELVFGVLMISVINEYGESS